MVSLPLWGRDSRANFTSNMGTPIHAIVAILGRDVAFLGSPIIPVTLFVFSLDGKAAVLSSITGA